MVECLSQRNNPNRILIWFRVHNDDDSRLEATYADPTILAVVEAIIQVDEHGSLEYLPSIGVTKTVLTHVRLILLLIPLNVHSGSIVMYGDASKEWEFNCHRATSRTLHICYTHKCWEERPDVGNNSDTNRRVCPGYHFMRCSGPPITTTLSIQGRLAPHFRPDDDERWLLWLADQTSFAFYGRSGRLNVHKEARTTLRKLVHDARIWQQNDLHMTGYLWLVKTEHAAGNTVGARQALQEMEQLARREGFALRQSDVDYARLLGWQVQGNLHAAGEWAARVVFDPDAWDPNRSREFLILVRVYLAQHHYTEARVALERFNAFLDRPGAGAMTIEYLALHAVALYGDGQCEQARAVAARLLMLTEPAGYIRVYLDAGEPMQRVLQSLLDPPHDQDDTLRPRAIAYGMKLLAAFAHAARDEHMPSSPSKAHHPLQPPALAEPLTQREQEVLGLLVAGASNQEIATQLVIAPATVKKHVSNVLGKLQVESRTQAVARAREGSLLA